MSSSTLLDRRPAGPTAADLDLVRAVLNGPHDELELAVLVVRYRDHLLAPFRALAREWLAVGALEPALLVARAVDHATGVEPAAPS